MKRLFLILILLGVPVLATAAIYRGTVYVLAATSRTIDPKLLIYAAVVEFAVFLWVAILEVRARW